MTGPGSRAAARLAAVAVLLSAVAVSPAGPVSAAEPVPGEFVFIQSPDRYNYYLYAANATTGARRRISTHQAVGRPSFSPGGARIAFSGPFNDDDSLGRYALYSVRRDGRGLKRISTSKFAQFDPAWSPDGKNIAFTRDLTGSSESSCCSLALVYPDGRWLRAIPNTDRGTFPSWSPDSTQIAFIRPDGLYVIKRNGTGRVRLAAGKITTPEWSSDGLSIAYVQRVDETHSALRTIPAGGGTPTTRWQPNGHAEAPVWGVDGTTLYATFHQGVGDWARKASAIYRVPAEGAATIQVDATREIHFLDYHPLLPATGSSGVGRVTTTQTGLSWRVVNATATPAVEPTPFGYGSPGDHPVTGDWNRDGVDTAGLARPSGGSLEWHLKDGVTGTFAFGQAGDVAVSGDWNGDGVDSPGVVRVVGDRLVWYFRSRNLSPATETSLTFGSVVDGVPDYPVTGDWNGDGVTSIGVTRRSGAELQWLLDNSTSTAAVHYNFRYGQADDRPVTGDWDGDGDDTPGLTRATGDNQLNWSVRNSNSAGPSTTTFVWGASSDLPVTGDWDRR